MLVQFIGNCTWTISSNGLDWTIVGDTNGNWTLTTIDGLGKVIWRGTKSGALGTTDGDTPAGTYVRTEGCDTTGSRTVSIPCTSCPSNSQVCCEGYQIQVTGSGSQDGTWTVYRSGDSPVWTTEQTGGSAPAGGTGQLLLRCNTENWEIFIYDDDSDCEFRFTYPQSECAPASGWTLVSNTCEGEPSITLTPLDCPSSSSISSSSADDESESSSSSVILAGTSSSSSIQKFSSSSGSSESGGVQGTSSSSVVNAGNSSSSQSYDIDCGEINVFQDLVGETGYWISSGFDEATDHVINLGTFSIDVSDPAVEGVRFGPESALDDILVMVPSSASVTWTQDGSNIPTITLPSSAIIFEATIGTYMTAASTFHEASRRKIIEQAGGVVTATIPAGDSGQPEFTADDLASAGFFVRKFSDGLAKSELQSRGYIDGSENCAFKLYFIPSGAGFVEVGRMTCDAPTVQSSESSDDDLSSIDDTNDCLDDCSVCCDRYMLYLSGMPTLPDVNLFGKITPSSCTYRSFYDSNYILSINERNNWEVVFPGFDGVLVMEAPHCGICPPRGSSAWTVKTNTIGGNPSLDVVGLSCNPPTNGNSSSSSSSEIDGGREICDFEINSAGGNDGYDEQFDVSGLFNSGGPYRVLYFTWQPYDIKDRMVVSGFGSGTVFYDSGCKGTDETPGSEIQFNFAFTQADGPIRIQVIPDCEAIGGTGWWWNARCEAPFNCDVVGCLGDPYTFPDQAGNTNALSADPDGSSSSNPDSCNYVPLWPGTWTGGKRRRCHKLFVYEDAYHDGEKYILDGSKRTVLRTEGRKTYNAYDGPFHQDAKGDEPSPGPLLDFEPYWYEDCGIGGWDVHSSFYNPNDLARSKIHSCLTETLGSEMPAINERHRLILYTRFYREGGTDSDSSVILLASHISCPPADESESSESSSSSSSSSSSDGSVCETCCEEYIVNVTGSNDSSVNGMWTFEKVSGQCLYKGYKGSVAGTQVCSVSQTSVDQEGFNARIKKEDNGTWTMIFNACSLNTGSPNHVKFEVLPEHRTQYGECPPPTSATYWNLVENRPGGAISMTYTTCPTQIHNTVWAKTPFWSSCGKQLELASFTEGYCYTYFRDEFCDGLNTEFEVRFDGDKCLWNYTVSVGDGTDTATYVNPDIIGCYQIVPSSRSGNASTWPDELWIDSDASGIPDCDFGSSGDGMGGL